MTFMILNTILLCVHAYLNILAAKTNDVNLSVISLIGFACFFAVIMFDVVKLLH